MRGAPVPDTEYFEKTNNPKYSIEALEARLSKVEAQLARMPKGHYCRDCEEVFYGDECPTCEPFPIGE